MSILDSIRGRRHTPARSPKGFSAAGFLVPDDGFVWHTDLRPVSPSVQPPGGSTDAWLVPSGGFVLRDPAPKRRLLEAFAALGPRPHPDAVAAFAGVYGFLTDTPTLLDGPDGRRLYGEPLSRWLDECQRFTDLWEVWQGIRATSGGDLDTRIVWFRQGDAAWPGYLVTTRFHGTSRRLIHRRVLRWGKVARARATLEPYRDYLARRAVERFRGHGSPLIDDAGGVRFVADCLLATIHAELATEVLRGR